MEKKGRESERERERHKRREKKRGKRKRYEKRSSHTVPISSRKHAESMDIIVLSAYVIFDDNGTSIICRIGILIVLISSSSRRSINAKFSNQLHVVC